MYQIFYQSVNYLVIYDILRIIYDKWIISSN